MRIFGIDPGIAGAIAILDEKKIVDQAMPIYESLYKFVI